MLNSAFFTEALSDNEASLAIRAEAMILAEVDGRAVVPCRNLEVEVYAKLEHCQLKAASDPRPGAYRYWGGEDYDQLLHDL